LVCAGSRERHSQGPKPITSPTLTLEPIGFIRSPLATKVEAERQPRAAGSEPARIELLPGKNFEHALEDLEQWEMIWVVFWFHLNTGWRPKVLPPRSTTGRKGVFSTRSPHRPNPIGMSVVRLERIEGLTLHITGNDMLEGTPVLDLKPYVAYTDAHAEAGNGWLKAAQPDDPINKYTVHFGELAAQQAAWIETHTGLKLRQRIQSTLTLGPEPHPYRRIRAKHDHMQLAVKEWRVRFQVTDGVVRVLDIHSGFRASQLAVDNPSDSLNAHREYVALFQ
jgi:tRNA (adenine37-N6)-methyltransferase